MERESFWRRSFLKPLYLEVRCPDCQTVYRIDSRDVENHRLPYQCWNCGCAFRIDVLPGHNPKLVVIDRKSQFELKPQGKVSSHAIAAKICPKCGALNAKKDEVCRKCHYIFAVEYWKKKEAGIIPLSLIKFWHEVLKDYQNLKKHLDFLERCEQLDMLPFALMRYERLRSMHPQDSIAQDLYFQTMKRLTSKSRDEVVDFSVTNRFPLLQKLLNYFNRQLVHIPWEKVSVTLTLGLSCAVIYLGFRVPGLSNLIGLGFGLIFLQILWLFFYKWRF